MTTAEWDKVFDIFGTLTHLCGGLVASNGDLTELTMSQLIGNGQACVLVVSEGGNVRPDKGIYSSSVFPHNDHWSDTDSIQDMTADQLAYLSSHRNLREGTALQDTFLTFQWLLTLEGIYDNVYFSIEDWALHESYDTLFWDAYQAFTPYSYPNVILMDFVGIVQQGDHAFADTSGEVTALAMAVNLELASQNCLTNGGQTIT
jgi:hypothetical protein